MKKKTEAEVIDDLTQRISEAAMAAGVRLNKVGNTDRNVGVTPARAIAQQMVRKAT